MMVMLSVPSRYGEMAERLNAPDSKLMQLKRNSYELSTT